MTEQVKFQVRQPIFGLWKPGEDVLFLNPVSGLPWTTLHVAEAQAVAYHFREFGWQWTELNEFFRDGAQDFPFYSQRDDEWKNIHLGYGNTTIGQYGCVITSMAMMLTQATGSRVTPLMVNEEMKRVKGYTGENGNLVVWNKLADAFPIVKFVSYNHYETTAAPVNVIDSALAFGDYIIVRVDIDLNTNDVDNHFVLIVGGDENQYVIHDPWPLPANQREYTIPDAYCKVGWDTARAIFSIAQYSRAE